MLNALYNQVDEEVHKLVILSNKSQKQLDSLLEAHRFEEQTQQVTFTLNTIFPAALQSFSFLFFSNWQFLSLFQIKLWFSVAGEKQLAPLESLTLSAAKIKEMRESLSQFLEESVVKIPQLLRELIMLYLTFRKDSVLNLSFLLTEPAETWPAAGQRVSRGPSRGSFRL